MSLPRKPAAAALAALALAALPSVAAAHDGNHPFANCSEAYAHGYANIPESDSHYGKHLDRDNDGVGCDKPPAGFVPAQDRDGGGATGSGSGRGGTVTNEAGQKGTDLAETGGNSATPYLAAGGAAVALAGGGLLVASRRRRAGAGG
ncbi:excalibur calcium-binding domain-containing protein [Streptomyces tagetis]|uniref:Excalibur calcium-binding domain-containing protein n=1 Tax=Streptomyces tagetis TaxID=2820809 RepID=A0A940XMF7_9ACTN|nr:excalibur calcium-binding domain-containing protein [Streptomyces sp. RG38]MBQ0830242.1 excalibur calcium-binding domain-containing protein [Streptomyces sp. RG38]